MKPLRDQEEVEEVEPKETSVEEELGEEDQARCYKYDEQGHMARDYPHLRQPWCSHC
jgi:hypothetical protein